MVPSIYWKTIKEKCIALFALKRHNHDSEEIPVNAVYFEEIDVGITPTQEPSNGSNIYYDTITK